MHGFETKKFKEKWVTLAEHYAILLHFAFAAQKAAKVNKTFGNDFPWIQTPLVPKIITTETDAT